MTTARLTVADLADLADSLRASTDERAVCLGTALRRWLLTIGDEPIEHLLGVTKAARVEWRRAKVAELLRQVAPLVAPGLSARSQAVHVRAAFLRFAGRGLRRRSPHCAGELTAADALFDRILELDPDPPISHGNLRRIVAQPPP